MFAGHYAVSFLVKKAESKLPLWILFLATQLLDILWAIFVLFGIEHYRIVPGIYRLAPTRSLLHAVLAQPNVRDNLVSSCFCWISVDGIGFRLAKRGQPPPIPSKGDTEYFSSGWQFLLCTTSCYGVHRRRALLLALPGWARSISFLRLRHIGWRKKEPYSPRR